jgi:hypothetical protein
MAKKLVNTGNGSNSSIGNKTILAAKASAIFKKIGILLLSKIGMDIKMAPTLKKIKKNN